MRVVEGVLLLDTVFFGGVEERRCIRLRLSDMASNCFCMRETDLSSVLILQHIEELEVAASLRYSRIDLIWLLMIVIEEEVEREVVEVKLVIVISNFLISSAMELGGGGC